MSLISGSSFTTTDIPIEHPTIVDFTLTEPFSGSLVVSQSVRVEVSGSQDDFFLGKVSSYESGGLEIQIESVDNETEGNFSNWIIVKTTGGLRSTARKTPLETAEEVLNGYNDIEGLVKDGKLPSVGGFDQLSKSLAGINSVGIGVTNEALKQGMIDGFLKCYKQQSKLPSRIAVEVACFLKGVCLAKVIHKFAQAHLSIGDSELPNLKLPPGMPSVPPGVTTAPQNVIKGTERGKHIGKPLFIRPAIEVLLGIAFVVTYTKSKRPGFTIEQARELQATEFAKALKNYFKTTIVIGVNDHNKVLFGPSTPVAGYFNGSTVSPLGLIPPTGFSIAVGKISNPELTDDPLKNFIEDYKDMMKEQSETKAGTPIEVAQLKMAKRVASAMLKLFNSIEIEGNHFAPLMLSMPGQSGVGTVLGPPPVPSPATIVAPFPPIPGTNKGKWGIEIGKGKLIP
jgi:hypothetical protein